MSRESDISIGAGLLLALLLSGCGGSNRPEVVPVSGRVTYKGQPVQDARVTFRTKDSPRAATGITDSDGIYELTTFDSGDGAVPGEHTVTVAKFEKQAGIPDEGFDASNPDAGYSAAMEAAALGRDKPKSTLPSKYADPATTPLTRTVVSGEENDFSIELED